MSEWFAVNKQDGWNSAMRTNIVHCSDGCVDLNDKQINYCSLHNVVSDGYVIFTDGNKLTWQQLKDSENKEKYSYSMTENNYSVSKFSNNVKEIVLPNTITTIGYRAFYRCTNLKKIVLPQNLKRIEAEEALDSIGATEITIPKSITFIGKDAFRNSQITNFNYAGTMSEWFAVNKQSGWNSYMRTNIVHCSDGCVNLSDAQIPCPTHETPGTQG